MKNKTIKSGFSLMELIVVVAIIGALSGAAYLGVQGAKRSSMNNKMLADLVAIANGLDQYRRDHNNSYPIPEPGTNMNVNCYYADATYAHDCEEASFIQGMIDNSLLGVKYLQEVPTDPRTGSRYAYGVSKDGKYFQVAGVWDDGGSYEARTAENIAKGFHLPSLIRSYDSPNFVVDKGEYLPYSPDHLVFTAKLQRFEGVTIISDGSEITDPDKIRELVLATGDTVETGDTGFADIYFGDGSVSHLDGESSLVLSDMIVGQNDEKNLITRIKLFLSRGKVWNKVVRLASDSEFNIETSEAIAGVRGTEFKVDADHVEMIVRSGKVGVYEKPESESEKSVGILIAMIADGTQGDYIDITPDAPKKVTGLSVVTTPDSAEVEEDYHSAFPKVLNNTVVPRILKAGGSTVTLEKIEMPFTQVYSTLSDNTPLSFTTDSVTGNYTVSYIPSADPVRFYFQDVSGNRSGLSIQTVLNDLSEEISFEDAVDTPGDKPKAKWDLPTPPSRLVAGTTDNNFSFTAAVLNQQELEEELEEGEFLSYKLIIYTPSICLNRDTNTDFSMEGEFAINPLTVGKCVYAVEVGAGELYPDHFDYSFGTSTPAKSVEVITKDAFDISFAVKTGADCATGQMLESWDKKNLSGGTHAAFGDIKLLLCADPSSEDGEVSYQWGSGYGMIEDETAKETFITVPKGDIAGSEDGLVFDISLTASNESHTVDTKTQSYHLIPPTVSSVSLSVVGQSMVRQKENLNLKAEISDSAFDALTPEEKNVTNNCTWEVSGSSSWNVAAYTDTLQIPEDAASGEYTITCTIPYLLYFNVAESPLIATTTFTIPAPENPFLVACVGDATDTDRSGDEASGYKNSNKNTYYTPGGECWALGNAKASVGENCTTTCGNIGLGCEDGSWNDTSNICRTLVGDETGTSPDGGTVAKNYAPVWVLNDSITPAANECRTRSTTLPFGIATASCSSPTFDQYERRICKCVSQ